LGICRLCNESRELRNSHILSEFLYDDLYNDKHQLVGINGIGSRGRQLIQKGIREPLLCESCEQHINEHCEKPFRSQWFDTSSLPVTWNPEDMYWGKYDYTSFKLFHLSVLFRAGVSSLPTYRAVSLGPHQERIRKMLLERDPGPTWLYPIYGYAVVHHVTRSLVRLVSAPEQMSYRGHRCYGMMFGGVNWCYGVSSHRNPELELAGLRADGRMPFHAVPWNEVGIVQDAAEILRGAKRVER
jgi:hypothetical protein